MKSFLAHLRHGFSRAAMACAVGAAVLLSGCGSSQGTAKKETDPAKVEQKRQQESQQYGRERQGK